MIQIITFIILIIFFIIINYDRINKISKNIINPSYIDIFNVNNFNIWFNEPKLTDININPNIYLRCDKLSKSLIYDYIFDKYNLDLKNKKNKRIYSKFWGIEDLEKEIYNFEIEIHSNWIKQITNNK